MDESLLKEINLNVRYVNHLIGCDNSNHKLKWRHLYDYEVIYVVSGEIIVETKSEKYSVTQSQLHVMQPFVEHTRYFPDNKTCTYFSTHLDFFYDNNDYDFSVDDAYIRPIEEKNYNFIETSSLLKRKKYEGIKVIPVMDIYDSLTIERCFLELYKAFKIENMFKTIEIKAKVYELLFCILNECQKRGLSFMSFCSNLHTEIISDFISLVHECYMKKFDLNQIAGLYGLSKNHFSKIFSSSQDVAPYNYIISVRLEEAKKLLKSGKYMINEIAEMVGYEDVHYFSRLFKRKEGISPLNYIKKMKKTDRQK